MVAFRSLISLGMIVALVVGWLSQRKPKSPKKSSLQEDPDLRSEDPVDLEAALHDSHWQRRLKAIKILTDNPSPQSLEQLLLLCSDPVSDVREAAAQGIRFHGHEALDGLRDILKNGSLDGRETAVHLLVELHDPDSKSIFIDVLRHDKSAWVRIPAVQALVSFGGEDAEKALIEALNDPHSGVVEAVHSALSELGTETALAALNQTNA